MKISKGDIRSIFLDLIDGKMSREDADSLAFRWKAAADAGNLEFIPYSDRNIIWDSIMFLYGIDIMESPGNYLHTVSDIADFLKKIELER